jgi:hypothetical protein
MANPTPKFDSIAVSEVFDTYPDAVSEQLLFLRQLIFETASEIGIDDLEETLKWGEPSYLTKKGSTIRVAWRKSFPNEYGMFFNCKTTLIETFKEVYRESFKFEGNRAILFLINTNKNDSSNRDRHNEIPIEELKHCISLSLTYHSIKHLPMLGI